MPGQIGNKGGGRKPLEVELENKTWHLDKWEGDTMVAILEKKIASKKYSVRDMFLLMALQGDKTILTKYVDKILPNLIAGTGEGGEFTIKWKDE